MDTADFSSIIINICNCILYFKIFKLVCFNNIFFFFYIIYLSIFLTSNTFKFLSNLNNNEGIYDILGNYFTQYPKLFISIQCYHKEKLEKVITFKKNFEFPYYSWKDVSGLFLLEKEETITKYYPFIKLYLKTEINFSEAISYLDYINYKNHLYETYKNHDKNINLEEVRIIPNFKPYTLICNNPENTPSYVSKRLYIFFTIFFLGQFYKTYFQSQCSVETFKIRKLISTRYDINNNENYQQMEPGFNYDGKTFTYERKNTGNRNENYQLIEPNQEELNNSIQYNNYIPNYQVTNVGKSIGVVQDLQSAPPLNINKIIKSDVIIVENNNH